ncbi:MAG: 2,3-bisphosphoglycerate-dependent phosphoglycerate mutase [Fimbriimonadaceae bacterium]|nr:2,3-bisphosphoglycerate-dependent phosphoglycerate mutase [Fimbriimonadaceae bacterium]
MPQLILVRHGQSLWNLENRFTGWVDVPLTAQGEDEARMAGERLRGKSIAVAYTSVLTRANHTLRLIMETAGLEVPVIRDQALNERDYGDLAGLNKDDMRAKYGEEQVHIWRRSYDVPPPGGESLKMCRERTEPFFERAIMGDIRQGKDVLVCAHGNSNRSIVMALESMSPDDVLALELATGIPRVYQLERDGTVTGIETLH